MTASSTSSSDTSCRRALVTGASSGLGREMARYLAAQGLTVFGTCRDPEALADSDRLPGVEYLPLEVTDPAGVAACAKLTGPVDLLVNNAGMSQLAPFEDLDDRTIEHLFAVNVFGPARMAREYLPGMRAARGGTIIMVGSLMAEFPLPYQSAYAASKLALQGLARSLRYEVAPFGVRVSVVQPGYYRSAISRRRERVELPGSAYATALAAASDTLDGSHSKAGDPAEVARLVWRIANHSDPAPVYSVGASVPLQLFLKRLLTGRLVERLIARRYPRAVRTPGKA
ncbi:MULTISPECIES: SDR family oxidoreductase [Streptomyces]|uniref:2-hydroxycyclohexanecarboxyl-CoA dehydrogenase n=1 Tax=Streptomyces sviceus (strain ATCC 29083 / DSM 924 / JCM 4929 / NBRC 13980 / NCIMB 11184 / NRRL 5439 / UC 5370) TaxID=463191 RepID=B5I3L2_STRX2|nr:MULTISPECIES: SDR family oxidoreductase [Streptomyces]EDY59667.1 2-hydroxycyclohexanecarboxyl-CoA dehydrogenase [Streptomyces sviceus ATCC 29083]MYT03288.1 SDR family NAD(P)-dependent oxidoreductase [Streptomyces sp. SID5470]